MMCYCFMYAGSTDGKIHCWNAESGQKVAVLNAPSDHTGPIQHVQFNPKYMMLASACSNMVKDFTILYTHQYVEYILFTNLNKSGFKNHLFIIIYLINCLVVIINNILYK